MIFCSEEELRELTGRVHRQARVRVLTALHIAHIVRPDGKILVSRSHVERLLSGHVEATPDEPTNTPDWSALA